MQTLKERAQHVMRKASIEDYENFVQEIANAPEPDPVRWLIYAGDSLRAETADRAEAASFKIEGFRVVPLYTSPPAPSVPDGLRTIPNHAQLTQILNGLDRCVAAESKREFLRVWIRDWTVYKLAAAPTQAEAPADVARDVRLQVESEFAALLPGVTYMDEPDGGIPAVQEQVKRMARDSEARAMGKEINHG